MGQPFQLGRVNGVGQSARRLDAERFQPAADIPGDTVEREPAAADAAAGRVLIRLAQRPGQPTVQFIQKVLNRITMFGAIYLGIVAICPLIVGKVINNSSLAIGGTSVIIVVGVALETVQALESQMLMRQYKGFLE